MWQYQNLWRKPGRGYRWRWSPVVGKTQHFEDAVTTGWPLRTVANMEWGWLELLRQTVCAIDVRAGEVELTCLFGHQKIVSPRSLSLNPYTTKLCFYFNLIFTKPELFMTPSILGFLFQLKLHLHQSHPLASAGAMLSYSLWYFHAFKTSSTTNAYTLPSSPASRRYSLGPLDHSFCVLTTGNTPRDFYINDAGPFLIHC